MCGIAGIIRFDGRPVDEVALARMSAKISHRGPDDEGVYIHGAIGLAHRRLTILDLSQAARQPMRDESNGAVLCYNGEAFNFREMRRRLSEEGCRFESSGDTEVLLQACRVWGVPKAAREVDGMFAFGYWDERLGELWLARDRTGIKPLYYHWTDQRLIFASEIKAILGDVEPQLDETALLALMLPAPLHDPHTLFRGVRSLEGGHVLRIGREGAVYDQAYYSLAEAINEDLYRSLERSSDAEVTERFSTLVDQAVELHLVSDAPVATLCSGGLDSSLVTCLSKTRLLGLQAYHAHVEGRYSELPWAQELAAHAGVPLHVATMNPEGYVADLAKVTYANECPLSFHPNTVPFYQVCRLASERGIKVLMTGEGADELFGGYSTFRSNARRRRIDGWRRRLTRGFNAIGLGKVSRFAAWLTDSDAHWGPQSWAGALTTRGRSLMATREARERYGFVSDPVERAFHADSFSYLHSYLQSILWRNDRMGMIVGLENRVPYLENELVRHALNLPMRFKLRGKENKWVLRRVADPHLPRGISRRSKMGFPVDVREFARPRREFFERGFLEAAFDLGAKQLDACVNEYPETYFRFVAIEIWGQMFFQGAHPDQVSERLKIACPLPHGRPARTVPALPAIAEPSVE